MKRKRTLTIILSALCLSASAQTYTDHKLKMADQFGAAGVSPLADAADVPAWTQDGFALTPAIGGNAKGKVPAFKTKNEEVRCYALNTITISLPEGSTERMTDIRFKLSKQGVEEQTPVTASCGEMKKQSAVNPSAGDLEPYADNFGDYLKDNPVYVHWEGYATSVTFTVGAKNDLHMEAIVAGSGQLDFTKVEIQTFQPAAPVADTESEFYVTNASGERQVLSEWSQGNLHFLAEQGADAASNLPAWREEREARLYDGNRLTVSSLDGTTLSRLEFVLSDHGLEQQGKVIASSGTVVQSAGANVTWSGDAASVTFTVQDAENKYGTDSDKKSGQFCYTQLNVTYGTVTLRDDDSAAPAPGSKTVVLDRAFVAGWNSVVLPFETTAAALGASKAVRYTGTTELADGSLCANFAEVATMSAHTPYLVKFDNEVSSVNFGHQTVTAPAAALEAVGDDAHFVLAGTYQAAEVSDIAEGDYIIVPGGVQRAAGGNALSAYRAYLRATTALPVKALNLVVDGENVTAVRSVKEQPAGADETVYDLAGRRLPALQRGINIVGGKKILK